MHSTWMKSKWARRWEHWSQLSLLTHNDHPMVSSLLGRPYLECHWCSRHLLRHRPAEIEQKQQKMRRRRRGYLFSKIWPYWALGLFHWLVSSHTLFPYAKRKKQFDAQATWSAAEGFFAKATALFGCFPWGETCCGLFRGVCGFLVCKRLPASSQLFWEAATTRTPKKQMILIGSTSRRPSSCTRWKWRNYSK